MNNFFNTTNENGNDLKTFTENATSQNEIVLKLMQFYKKSSASQLIVHFKNTPTTSIRRALTTLYKNGNLVKTDEKVKGNYGRNEYLYSVL